jgi:hypothetical protein
MTNKYEETKSLLNVVRQQQKEHKINEAITKRKQLLKENSDNKKKKDFIAITNDIKFGNNVLQTQIDAFKASVNPGAKFADENSEEPDSNPLVYLPETGNLVFSGKIPNLGNMKFQFSLMDITNAPYIWSEGLPLTDEVVTTLNKLKAFYLNWKEQWLLREDLLQKLDKQR